MGIFKILGLFFLTIALLFILYTSDLHNKGSWMFAKDCILLILALSAFLGLSLNILNYEISAKSVKGGYHPGQRIDPRIEIMNNGKLPLRARLTNQGINWEQTTDLSGKHCTPPAHFFLEDLETELEVNGKSLSKPITIPVNFSAHRLGNCILKGNLIIQLSIIMPRRPWIALSPMQRKIEIEIDIQLLRN